MENEKKISVNFNVMSVGERLKYYIETNFSSQKEFADILDMPRTTLYRYINNINKPTTETLASFKKSGLSIDWLVDGSGSIYAKNSKGMELLGKYKEKESIEVEHPYLRIKTWINKNYGSLKNFTIILDLDYDDIYSTLYENVVPDLSFIDLLEKAGCNTDWILTGDGCEYANNPLGEILKSQTASRAIKTNQDSEESEIEKDNFPLFSFEDLVKIFRMALKAENEEKTKKSKRKKYEI